MTGPRLGEERDMLAAEHALGVLEGAELQRARELVLSSPEFAQAVEDWQHSLAAIAGEAPEQQPDPAVWARIERAVQELPSEGATVVRLRRQLRVWQGLSLAASAAAALALFVAIPRGDDGLRAAASGPVLVAGLSSEETGTSLAAAYDPVTHSLLVTPGVLKGDAAHEHELWIIPPGGDPVAVGMVAPGAPQRLPVQLTIAPHFHGRSTLAISVEPVGGSPTGRPTGPVIATGELSSI